ncbi:diacylglycerol kinase [Bifidobacterium sp. 82T24]|uniref:diacylglycerol/lipid kinase family protein n=1 Tax=Bifidobacterium pluvialisilvae TaxID=2834436 RepID=UPI001C56DD38|nr:diacylglycerol kinase family protein [Bifidobacterium pluvialisilvae]MBW3088154.1 diacylglycerol kinase [Bifidobacterium pluvialisilvae]
MTDSNTPTPTGTIAVVTNPASDNGRGRLAGRKAIGYLTERCSRTGFTVIDVTGATRRESLENARRHLSHADALVVVGGDGMVSLGVNAVADCDIPLGIVACGSGNDFARGLGLPVGHVETSIEAILAALSYQSSINLDLGHAESPDDDGTRVNTFFAGMLNCSIDAAINNRANHSRLPFGGLRYLEAGIREALHVKDYGFHIDVTYDDGDMDDYDLTTPLLAVANARFIGSGIEASPDSDLGDGMLEMLWAKWRPSAPQALRVLAQAYRGTHLSNPLIGYRRITAVTISGGGRGEEPPLLMADGEIVGRVPVRVDVHHKALKLLVPPSVLRQWHDASNVGTRGEQ